MIGGATGFFCAADMRGKTPFQAVQHPLPLGGGLSASVVQDRDEAYEFWALEFSRLGILIREVRAEADRLGCVWARAYCDNMLDSVAKAERRLACERDPGGVVFPPKVSSDSLSGVFRNVR